MRLFQALVIDDEPRGISTMQKLLALNCPEVSVVGTCNSADEAVEAIPKLKPDLLFLDIAMPVKSGLELLREMKDFDFEVIFVTAHDKYVIDAFRFSAVDYLLKPVEEDLLIDAVRRAGKRIAEQAGSKNLETFLQNMQQKHALQSLKLCIPSLRGFQVVEIKDTIYCEAAGNYTNFHFSNRTPIWSSKSIHEYEDLLSDCGFLRIHKSFLVNLEHIREYLRGEGGSVMLSNGNEVEVSRRKKDVLLTRMKAYYKF